jgi:hypothetical protein
MASHTSPAASFRSRVLRRALLGAALIVAPLAAHAFYPAPSGVSAAPVYVWRDAGGVVHFTRP